MMTKPHFCTAAMIILLFCRGGKICLTDHFKPLWARNVPKFGIAHAMALGVSNQITIIVKSQMLDALNPKT